MIQNVTDFEWTATKVQAVALLAQGDMSDEAIASLLKVTRVTLWRWKQVGEFQDRIRVTVEQFRLAAVSEGIADKVNRLRSVNDRWQRMHAVIRERAASKEMQSVPGGKSGLVTKQLKGIGKGDDFQVVEVYQVDTGLLAQMLAHEQQAAKELGQWTEKSEVAVNDGGIIDALQRKFAEITSTGQEAEVPAISDNRGSEGS